MTFVGYKNLSLLLFFFLIGPSSVLSLAAVKCGNGCKECETSDKCTLCKNGFFLYEKNHCKKCNEKFKGCLKCSKNQLSQKLICEECFEGKFVLNGQCSGCMEGCSECKEKGRCLVCYGGFKKVGDLCEGKEETKFYTKVILWVVIVLPILVFIIIWVVSSLRMFCFRKDDEEETVEIGFNQEYTQEIDL